MKMIIAIISDVDNEPVSQALISSGFRVTRVASTGGFFRRGSTTLMIGCEDDRADAAIQVIKENTTPPEEPTRKRATLFVLNVDHFSQV
ncbi:MAG: cyclic-di-AMP receptor [Anaerolineales bacterium]|nr:cyclic-di-AMP receptor [Anaerolineales bacterium]